MGARRRAPAAAGGAPRELLDEGHRVWGGSLARHRAAAAAHALARGWVRFYGDNPQPFPDRNRLRAEGIPTRDSAAIVAERHEQAPDFVPGRRGVAPGTARLEGP